MFDSFDSDEGTDDPIEFEQHVISACSGYVYARQLFQDLFRESISTVGQLLTQPNPNHVAKFKLRPISLSKLRRLMQFRLGSHDLPIEQGRMARPIVPRYLRRCTLCSRHAPGDERHFMLECPQFDDIRAQYPNLLQDARDSMRNLMWHQNQKALSDFVIAILDEPRT